jgi:hypothetical protein
MVLRRGTHHRRTANVDVLDDLFRTHARLRDGRLERVEIDNDQIDGFDPVLWIGSGVFGIVADGEDATVDAGATSSPGRRASREAGDIADIANSEAGVGGAAVPPVEINSTPSSARPRASSIRPASAR